MQKSEYIYIVAKSMGSNNIFVFQIGDKEIAIVQRPFLSNYLNKLGEDGWELVSYVDSILYLKRPESGALRINVHKISITDKEKLQIRGIGTSLLRWHRLIILSN